MFYYLQLIAEKSIFSSLFHVIYGIKPIPDFNYNKNINIEINNNY